jgi:hypothetical protein
MNKVTQQILMVADIDENPLQVLQRSYTYLSMNVLTSQLRCLKVSMKKYKCGKSLIPTSTWKGSWYSAGSATNIHSSSVPAASRPSAG